MLFINPMWHHESQRIGKQRCSPRGYALHVIAEMIGILGLMFLLVTPFVMALRVVNGTFRTVDLWLLVIPFPIGIVSKVLFQFSWWLARRRGFCYDARLCEASWFEAGERRTYKYPAEPVDGNDSPSREDGHT